MVHTHAPYSTAVACVLDELPVLHYQQLLLGGAVRVAPYATFGTPELAAAVREALAGRQAALMANHGSVAVGGSLDAAVENALLLEWLAALHHRASALGTPRVLTAEEQDEVVRAALSRGYGTTHHHPSRPGERMKVATVGVHVLDTHVIGIESIPDGSDGQLVETIRMSPAGTAGGTAVVLSRLGAEVSSYGAIGDRPDRRHPAGAAGRRGRRHVGAGPQGRPADLGVGDPGAAERRPAGVALHRRERRVHPRRPRPRSDGYDFVHLGGPEFLGGEAAGRLLKSARDLGATTSLDILAPGDPDMLAWVADALPHTDYLLPNDEQVLGFTGAASLEEGARALVERGVGCVAVTQGAKGALVVTADEVIEVPAYDIEVVDTTGCGDAFSAGFLRGLSLGGDLRAAARLGCATAAQVAQGLGTDAGSYTLASVQAFEQEAATR